MKRSLSTLLMIWLLGLMLIMSSAVIASEVDDCEAITEENGFLLDEERIEEDISEYDPANEMDLSYEDEWPAEYNLEDEPEDLIEEVSDPMAENGNNDQTLIQSQGNGSGILTKNGENLSETESHNVASSIVVKENGVAKTSLTDLRADVAYTGQDGDTANVKMTAATDSEGRLFVVVPKADLEAMKWTQEGDPTIQPASGNDPKTTTTVFKSEAITGIIHLPDGYMPGTGAAYTQTVTFALQKTIVESGEGQETTATTSYGTVNTLPAETTDWNIVEKTLTIAVSVVGEDATSMQLAGAKYQLTVGGLQQEKTTTGIGSGQNTYKLDDFADTTDVAGFLKLYGSEKPSEGDLKKAFTFTVEETYTPLFYNFPTDSEGKEQKTQTETICLADYFEPSTAQDGTGTWKALTVFAEFIHPLAKLTVAPAVTPTEAVGALFTDATKVVTNYGMPLTYTLKTQAPFATMLSDTTCSVDFVVEETTVPTCYVCTTPNMAVTLKAVVNDDGTITWEDGATTANPIFTHAKKKFYVNIQANDSKVGLGNITFKFRNGNGEWITTADGRSEVTSDAAGSEIGVPFEYSQGSTITVVQVTVPEGYYIESGAEKSLAQDDFEYTVNAATGDAGAIADAHFVNKQLKTNPNESITARKEWYENGNRFYNSSSPTTFYLALFDETGTNRVSQIYKVTAAKGTPYKNYMIEDLPVGTWVLKETDANGIDISNGSGDLISVSYSNNKITVEENSTTVHNVTIKNYYSSLPQGCQHVGVIGVRKVVLKEDRSLDTDYNGTVTIQIRYLNSNYKTTSQKKNLTVSSGQSSYVAFYVPMGDVTSKDVTIYEAYTGTNGKTYYAASGKYVRLSDKIYNVTMSSPSLTVSAASTTAERITVSNVLTTSDIREEVKGEVISNKQDQGDLVLTQRMIHNGDPAKVNGYFYIGLFNDPDLTSLRYVKKITFAGDSEITNTLKISYMKLEEKEVTFYLAQTDETGKPIDRDEGHAYSLNISSFTMNANNPRVEVVSTASIRAGSNAEKDIISQQHTIVTDPAVPATTTSTGLTAGSHCSVCGAVLIAQQVIPKLQAEVVSSIPDTSTVEAKQPQPMTVKAKEPSIKASKLKKKSRTISAKKAFTITNAQGTLRFKKLSGNKKITINKKTGKITLGKGLKKKTYKLKVKITAAGNERFEAGSKTVTVKILVQ